MADVNIKIVLNDKRAKRQIASLVAQMNRLKAATTGVAKAFQRTNKVTQEASLKLAILAERNKQAALRTQILENRLNKVGNAAKGGGKGFSTMNIALSSFIGNITSRLVSSAITGIINGFKEIVNRGREFEAALVGVGKTTDISGRRLEVLGKRLENIGRRIPVSTQRLLELATVAGQLGINSSKDIEAFTETLAKLELATDITGEEGAQSVAKILTITRELEENGTENIKKFGSVITKLGNDFAATEGQILKVANEVAKGTTVYNLASEDVLGLATAFKATGSEAEISGSTIQEIFKKIGQASTANGEQIKKFAEAAGQTTKEFKELFDQDPTAAFVKLTEGLGKAGLKGKELEARIEQLGFKNKRVTKSLAPLITGYQTLSRSIATARQEATDKNALDEETARAQNTLNADLTKLSNSFDRLSNSLFSEFSPALRASTQGLTNLSDAMADADTQALVLDIALIALGQGSLALFNRLTRADKAFTQNNKNAIELSNAYEETDESTQRFLGSITALVDETRLIEGPMYATRLSVDEYGNSVEVAEKKVKNLTSAITETKATLAFENEKLQQLKRFYKEDEIAKLESAFAKTQAGKEREAFLNFVASEGKRRQSEEFKRTIGLDRATIESARAKAEALKELRQGQDNYEKEKAQEKEQRELVLAEANNQRVQSEVALALFLKDQKVLFEDERLIALEAQFTREEEARIQAKISAAKTEEEKQAIINQTVTKGNQKKLSILQKNKEKEIKLEKIKNSAVLSASAGLFGALASVARTGGAKALGIYKALATAQAVISTFVAVNKTLAEPTLPYPANIIQAAAIGVQGAANVISIQQQSFEDGGIVKGSSFSGDKVQARVNSGEMILNRQQQSQLFSMANGQGSSQNNDRPMNITVQSVLDGEVISESVSRWVANGGQLGEVQ